MFETEFILDIQYVSISIQKSEFTCMLVRRSRIPPTAMQDKAGKSSSENATGQRKGNFTFRQVKK